MIEFKKGSPVGSTPTIVLKKIFAAPVMQGEDQGYQLGDTLDGKGPVIISLVQNLLIQFYNTHTELVFVYPGKLRNIICGLSKSGEAFSVGQSIVQAIL